MLNSHVTKRNGEKIIFANDISNAIADQEADVVAQMKRNAVLEQINALNMQRRNNTPIPSRDVIS